MSEQEENKLHNVLANNPFLTEIDKWQKDLDEFRDGRKKLEELQFILKSDIENFNRYQQNYAYRTEGADTFLHPELLPQPFIGDPRAPVWYLLLNPGYSFSDRYDHLGVCSFCGRNFLESGKEKDCIFDKERDKAESLKGRQDLLLRQLRLENGMPFYLLDDSFDTLKGELGHSKEGGFRWWRTVLFGANALGRFLLPECGVKQDPLAVGKKIFVLECGPYHSRNFDKKVLWKESEYTKFWAELISWAVETNRKFIVRSKQVASLLLQNKLLVDESNSLRFSSRQNTALTQQNLKGQDCVKNAIRNVLGVTEVSVNL